MISNEAQEAIGRTHVPFNNETHFEEHLRQVISEHVLPQLQGSVLLLGDKRGVDLCLVRNGARPRLFFIEVKYYNKAKNHSMVSLGRAGGKGFQPAALRDQAEYLERYMRWILGTAANPNYYLLSNAEVRRHLNRGEIGDKQNGLRRSVFDNEKGASKERMVKDLVRWLKSR